MKLVITKDMFRDAFRYVGRAHHFSYDGLGGLYDWIEDGNYYKGEEYELNVIALCCDFSEGCIEEVLESYKMKNIEELKEATTVVWHDDSTVLYLDF